MIKKSAELIFNKQRCHAFGVDANIVIFIVITLGVNGHLRVYLV